MVIVAFDRTNLLPTAKVFRDRYSDAIVVIARDNDQFTDGNPGLTDARKAAAAVSGGVVLVICRIRSAAWVTSK